MLYTRAVSAIHDAVSPFDFRRAAPSAQGQRPPVRAERSEVEAWMPDHVRHDESGTAGLQPEVKCAGGLPGAATPGLSPDLHPGQTFQDFDQRLSALIAGPQRLQGVKEGVDQAGGGQGQVQVFGLLEDEP